MIGSKLRPVLGLAFVFICGALVGSLLTLWIVISKVDRLASKGPAALRTLIVQRLDRELQLDDDQEQRVRAILEHRPGALRTLSRPGLAQATEIVTTRRQEIRAVLTPAQQQKFDALTTRDRRWGRLFPN